ncbi:MAG: hypothetical protein CBC27_01035, partial [Opitutia bacterium TMED67]
MFLFVISLNASAASRFVHPGLLHSQDDINRIKKAVTEKEGPIYEGFKILLESPFSKMEYRMQGPVEEWGRAPNINTGQAQNDAKAAYQNALMWAITGKQPHANKSIEILNAWAKKLKKVSGIDGVLASGLQGFQFVNAAELVRYTNSGWTEVEAKRCEASFKNAWLPTIEHYAYFANGNWETAALQTKMAIAVFCDDSELFEEAIRYSVNGCGNGSIPNMIVYSSGQCQETTRAQHYAQLGIGLLTCAAEVAWQQGVDLYGWNNNRILKGYEYIARFGLGEEVPYRHYLDRTGKYGFGGRNNHYTEISKISRGDFWPIYERNYQHYAKRRGILAPYSKQVVEMKRPEGHSSDHVGLGTLSHFRTRISLKKPNHLPGIPAGLVARSTSNGISLTWVKSVDPITAVDADSYEVYRANQLGGSSRRISNNVIVPNYHDTSVKRGELYFYSVKAKNSVGISLPSVALAANAGLPNPWLSRDIGDVQKSGFSEFNG